MADFDAIGTALAARFAPAQVTPPGGFTNVRASTADIPNQLSALPSVVCFLDEGEFRTGNGTREGISTWAVRFYYAATTDLTRDAAALRKWLSVLVDQLKLSVQLGGAVDRATVDGWKIGILTYAGMTYSGIELQVRIVKTEGWAAVA